MNNYVGIELSRSQVVPKGEEDNYDIDLHTNLYCMRYRTYTTER
jgi:hypothetical protein